MLYYELIAFNVLLKTQFVLDESLLALSKTMYCFSHLY
jgi:hypothetical protein